jgi:gliding motility-associated-like protein
VITVDGAKSPNYNFTYVNGTLTILPSLQSAVIPNAFTPNGDGVNDFWNIPELADFPTCIVSIYTRYGSLVFQSRGYGKPWDGTSNGSPVPMGTYYYIIDPRQDNIKPLSGYVAVIR